MLTTSLRQMGRLFAFWPLAFAFRLPSPSLDRGEEASSWQMLFAGPLGGEEANFSSVFNVMVVRLRFFL